MRAWKFKYPRSIFVLEHFGRLYSFMPAPLDLVDGLAGLVFVAADLGHAGGPGDGGEAALDGGAQEAAEGEESPAFGGVGEGGGGDDAGGCFVGDGGDLIHCEAGGFEHGV